MNKTLKKIISLVLTVLMLMSFASVAFAESYEVNGEEYEIVDNGNVDEHSSFTSVIIGFFVEIYNFLKYIFYDMFRGVAPQEVF